MTLEELRSSEPCKYLEMDALSREKHYWTRTYLKNSGDSQGPVCVWLQQNDAKILVEHEVKGDKV